MHRQDKRHSCVGIRERANHFPNLNLHLIAATASFLFELVRAGLYFCAAQEFDIVLSHQAPTA
jgi:hypothetical protein